jgi:hypothetical protein
MSPSRAGRSAGRQPPGLVEVVVDRYTEAGEVGEVVDGAAGGSELEVEQGYSNIGRVAAARKLLTLVYYGRRDGEIRVLAEAT